MTLKSSISKFLLYLFQIELYGENVLPRIKLNDEKYMEYLKSCASLNLNMPGAIETIHPHRFLVDLKPVEEFRHTPIIPISDKAMKQFQEALNKHHRSALYLELGVESIIQYAFMIFALYVGYRLINYAIELEDQSELAYHRMQEKRRNESFSL